ncbi:MAG: hypothetical protein H6815_11030 [Phycisphaeraceae bacterium]|nr:hypothetical protein [Phycisphaerales bacterium]MCB9860969.1 hypothetical protein [Phycisphaeraceae bacterium]
MSIPALTSSQPVLSCIACTILAYSCAAQVGTPKTVPQGLGDISPIDAPLYVDLSVDLRQEDNWSKVYRGIRIDAFGRKIPFLARKSGAVTAVFDQSEYALLQQEDQSYVMALPPLDTTYYLGDLPDNMTIDTSGSWLGWYEMSKSERQLSPMTQERRVVPVPRDPWAEVKATEAAAEQSADRPVYEVPVRGYMSDPAYRQERLNQLIDRAARAEQNFLHHS